MQTNYDHDLLQNWTKGVNLNDNSETICFKFLQQ